MPNVVHKKFLGNCAVISVTAITFSSYASLQYLRPSSTCVLGKNAVTLVIVINTTNTIKYDFIFPPLLFSDERNVPRAKNRNPKEPRCNTGQPHRNPPQTSRHGYSFYLV